jgi:hypothetical protein
MKKLIFGSILICTFSLWAAPVENWTDVKVPRPDIFKGWRNQGDYLTSHVPFMSLPRVKACDDQPLQPTGPSQQTKLYHEYKWGEYDNSTLRGDDEDRLCLIATRSKQKWCLKSDYIYTVVISDLFKDSCGQEFRGFWRMTFLAQDETMGALQSKGRTLQQRPGSNFPKDFVPAEMYPVPQDQFMFLTNVFKE